MKIARVIDVETLMEPEREWDSTWSYEEFLKGYTIVAVNDKLYQKKKRHSYKWIKQLTDQARGFDPRFNKTLFHLNTLKANQPVPGPILVDRMDYLVLQGGLSFSYGPDLFTIDKPDREVICPGISLREFTYQ